MSNRSNLRLHYAKADLEFLQSVMLQPHLVAHARLICELVIDSRKRTTLYTFTCTHKLPCALV